jgi:hypothetical protein
MRVELDLNKKLVDSVACGGCWSFEASQSFASGSPMTLLCYSPHPVELSSQSNVFQNCSESLCNWWHGSTLLNCKPCTHGKGLMFGMFHTGPDPSRPQLEVDPPEAEMDCIQVP